MKLNLILSVILLATISAVNALPHELRKRATTFMACPPESKAPPPTAFNVVMTPDPAVDGQTVNFTITGTPSVDIPPGSGIAALFVPLVPGATDPIGTPGAAKFCDNIATCPLPAGTSFTASLQATAPAKFPDKYLTIIAVGEKVSKTSSFCVFSIFPPTDGGAPPAPPADAPPATPPPASLFSSIDL